MQSGVRVMKPSPVTTFKVPQSQLLLELLVVPLNDPALLGHLLYKASS